MTPKLFFYFLKYGSLCQYNKDRNKEVIGQSHPIKREDYEV